MQREYLILGRKLQIHHGDITRLEVDAIVSSENSDLVMDRPDGASVSAAIRRAEGEELARDLARLGPIEPGRAVVTPARKLPCRWIIHAASVVRTEQGHVAKLEVMREAVRSALQLASGLGLTSIAFPAFGVRAASVPRHLSSEVMLEELVRALRERTTLRRIVVALFDPESFVAFFEAAMRRITAANEALRVRVHRAGDALRWSLEEPDPVARVLTRPVDDGVLRELARGVQRLRPAGERRLLDARRELEALGAQVRALVPDEVLARALGDGPRPIVLRLDEGLAGVPFELCRHEGRFLIERASVARRLVVDDPVHARGGWDTPQADRKAGRLPAVVLAGASPDDLPGASREAERILDLLWRRVADRVDLTFLGARRATRRAVLDALPGAALLHWCGHTRATPRGPRWSLSGEEALAPEDVASARLSARLVVANSCGSEDGVAFTRALLLAGARNVVTTLWDVDDALAERFALKLYEELALGRTLGEGLDAAREALRGEDPLHWAAYLHYGDPRERLIEPLGLQS